MPHFPLGLWTLEMVVCGVLLALDTTVSPEAVAPLPVRTWTDVGYLWLLWGAGFAALHLCRLNWRWLREVRALRATDDDAHEEEA